MYKRAKKAKLGRKASHRSALMMNLLRSLFTNGYLTTTTIKAKALKGDTLRLFSKLSKADKLYIQRELTAILGNRKIVEKAVKYVSDGDPKIKVVKVGYRDGDMAQTSKVTLVGYIVKKAKRKLKKADKKEEKKEEKIEKKEEHIEKRTVGKVVKEVFTGRKERARTRSGL